MEGEEEDEKDGRRWNRKLKDMGITNPRVERFHGSMGEIPW